MEPTVYLRFLLALVLVLGLILALSWGLKRLGIGHGAAGPLNRRKRLRVVEAATVDSRHRMVLVKRDAMEHLLLLGPGAPQVIERGIPALPEDTAAEPEPAAAGTILGRFISGEKHT